MTKLTEKISRNSKDTLQKYASSLFKDATLEFYGIKAAKIKELINVELPVVEVSDSSTDFVFLLEDGSYLHLEFQSSFKTEDLIRFAIYDLRLFKRDRRLIKTVVIYTSDVKNAPNPLDIGSMVYNPDYVMMGKYNGNDIYKDLDEKIKAGQDLSDNDILNLMFLPLMEHTLPRKDLAARSIEMAKKIPDETKREACIATTIAFAEKYLSKGELAGIMEVMKMTIVAEMLKNEEKIEMAKGMLRENISIDKIIRITRLDESTILKLKEEVDNE